MVLQEGGESLLMLKQLYISGGCVTPSVERKAKVNAIHHRTSCYLTLPYGFR